MKDLYCDECSNKLEVNYDPILEQVFVKPCMVCVNKYIADAYRNCESRMSRPVDTKALEASLEVLNELYKILNKGEKK